MKDLYLRVPNGWYVRRESTKSKRSYLVLMPAFSCLFLKFQAGYCFSLGLACLFAFLGVANGPGLGRPNCYWAWDYGSTYLGLDKHVGICFWTLTRSLSAHLCCSTTLDLTQFPKLLGRADSENGWSLNRGNSGAGQIDMHIVYGMLSSVPKWICFFFNLKRLGLWKT